MCWCRRSWMRPRRHVRKASNCRAWNLRPSFQGNSRSMGLPWSRSTRISRVPLIQRTLMKNPSPSWFRRSIRRWHGSQRLRQGLFKKVSHGCTNKKCYLSNPVLVADTSTWAILGASPEASASAMMKKPGKAKAKTRKASKKAA